MMRHETVERIRNDGIIAIIRADAGGDALIKTVGALAEGGIRCIELTMTTPGALAALETAAQRFPTHDILLGAGSVLDAETARLCILAGARYIVSPALIPDVIRCAHRYGAAVLPGALTPTEILSAWEMGADFVKLFPATLGGIDYLRAVRAPLPQVALIPTGGVTLENLADWIHAGAAAVGIGANLVKKEWVAQGKWADLSALARDFVAAWNRARAC